MQAAILAGGLGTRIRSLFPDIPKPMIPIRGIPFLEFQMNALAGMGVTHFVLCIGHMSQVIIDHFADKRAVRFSVEKEPLGTGGAIAGALEFLEDRFLIVNGDTFVTFDLTDLRKFHDASRSECTIVLTKRDDAGDYGSIRVDECWRVRSFEEKRNSSGSAYVNAGVCLAQKNSFSGRQGKFSLENDFFPQLAAGGRLFGHAIDGTFTDIGTPERFLAFKRKIEPDYL